MNESPIRVYLSGPAFHLRPKNTDWQYLGILTRLPEFAPGLIIHREPPSWHTVALNLRYTAGIADRWLGMIQSRTPIPNLESKLPRADLRRSRSEVVYAYGYCPINAAPVPLIFHTGAVDDQKIRESRLSPERIEAILNRRRRLMSSATLITVNSQAALENLARISPQTRPKMRLLPFFLPHLVAVDEISIREKFRNPNPLRLLFVGREARRKGLPEVLTAFEALNAKLPGKLELTVVSNFSDGPVTLPRISNLTHLPELDREAVQQRMRASHFLLMPSHFEGFGWVYLEAMAAGTIPVASDAPIQREILAEGAAGLLAAPDAARLEASLLPLLQNTAAMESLALNAWNRCRQNYLPKPVAEKMREVFAEARELGTR